ncbi:carbonic anhydrase 6 [Fukomys damarensis]|uniref:carbonic anhydrase 6 n=1 Tax=Fukomys damarensis TaxID=885580 RepID=UPI00053FEAD2|nr:carbonic anhydrase 6 [Fukomys damarensis]
MNLPPSPQEAAAWTPEVRDTEAQSSWTTCSRSRGQAELGQIPVRTLWFCFRTPALDLDPFAILWAGGELDEEHWPRGYPECGGNRQSPIDLQRRKVRFNSALRALDLEGYGDDEAGQFPVTNNGHTVQISLPSSMRMTGPDGTVYRAVQMHYHWGGESFEVSGSEHTIDGMRRAMEIHVVHYNAKYESYEVAKDAPGGLAVLAAFVEAENAENTYYSSFISNLASIKHAGQSTVLHGLSVLNMLPQDLFHYYSYEGSLTTPPCTQNVRWFVLADSVKISNVQVWKMENTLLTHQNRTLQNGYRSTQPLHSRVVEANFRYFPSSGECRLPARPGPLGWGRGDSLGDSEGTTVSSPAGLRVWLSSPTALHRAQPYLACAPVSPCMMSLATPLPRGPQGHRSSPAPSLGPSTGPWGAGEAGAAPPL